jgi:polyisoprenoid-binding protein YceI
MKTFLSLCFLVLFTTAFTVIDLKPVDKEDAVTFTIKNVGINTNGSLSGIKGAIKWDEADPENSIINVSVDVSTINTGIENRDDHLRREEYFNVEKYPTITFDSHQITPAADGNFNVNGILTIKGVAKNITFPFTVTNTNSLYVFEADFTINRLDFNVGKNSMVLSNDVKVKLKVEAAP